MHACRPTSFDWSIPDPSYNPSVYESPNLLGQPLDAADPSMTEYAFILFLIMFLPCFHTRAVIRGIAFNELDLSIPEHPIDRRSYVEKYQVIDGLPRFARTS